jgi:hypothetical protein
LPAKRKALFPVSLSNDRFASKLVISAIAGVAHDYDDITILIADKLQVYNGVSRVIVEDLRDPKKTGFSFMDIERKVSQTLIERERWLKRVQAGIGPRSEGIKWHVHSLAAFGDHMGFDVLRRVSIMYDIDHDFRADVDQWARAYVNKRYGEASPNVLTRLYRLSARYIIEEAALSIRIRVFGRLTDELYAGDTTEPIARLYWDRYSNSVWDLAGLPSSECRFSFHEYSAGSDDTIQWREIQDDQQH